MVLAPNFSDVFQTSDVLYFTSFYTTASVTNNHLMFRFGIETRRGVSFRLSKCVKEKNQNKFNLSEVGKVDF
jgi:hypothetical protein